ncbi:MFS transporter [Amorphus orientalis]|uniref:EmrB/QacA subfamily drug resistance transporter n=1 Tax=Amorphus orientalis TaxID=649198 RepID=A0AAE3VRZ1_9HYPH|nr:MFS transporter [Amorphus orientalis]MDQ0317664.1 EmrB/QacA subfamily drug resistance transporter [Amorphus orientalis]
MPRPNVTALIVASALFMENIDSTVIATSLPAVAADIGTDPIRLKLALTSYLLSLAVFIPVSGWAADRFGAKTVFRLAIGVFLVGSVGCSLSSSLPEFVLARIVQGMGGAMMTPVGRLVVLRTTPKPELLSAMAWLTVPALIGPLIGPPLGGFITTYFDWRWIFWINVPVGFVGILLVTFLIDNVRAPEVIPLDKVGFVLSGVGLSGLIFGLSVMGQRMMPLPLSLALVIGGAVSIALYVRHARRTEHPLIDLGLLSTPTFRASVLGGFFFRVGVGSIPFLLPLTLQLGLGMNPFHAGSLVFVTAIGALLMKATAKPIVRRFGFRQVLVVNGLISAAILACMGLFSLGPATTVIIGVLLVGGFFRSLQFTSINAIAYADIDQHRMSRATSFASVAQQVALSTGVTVSAFVLEAQRAARPGTDVLAGDFLVAFLVVAAIAVCSVAVFARLSPDAGSEMSGHGGIQSTSAAPR